MNASGPFRISVFKSLPLPITLIFINDAIDVYANVNYFGRRRSERCPAAPDKLGGGLLADISRSR
jgi:hypothetical protein